MNKIINFKGGKLENTLIVMNLPVHAATATHAHSQESLTKREFYVKCCKRHN
jgi:hypothetical protein